MGKLPAVVEPAASGGASKRAWARSALLGLVLAAWGPWSAPADAAPVKATEQTIAIPTYLAGEPDPNPMFYFGRGSQGAEGRVYPYPLYDSLTDVKSNKTYRIVYLENEYVRIGILPEIGGRLFEAIDKSNGYHFIYRQHVIKPALIGLIGAWISGGIEWNIPHHHRATTFLPVQYRLESGRDGSQTVWVGELELRQRMRWAVGYTLHPGRSYLECSVRILNRTPLPHSMLCFANVAVHVDQHYQVIYPPETQFVTFHSKHEFATWPIATTRYAGADFTRGVDVSWYSNHIAATSMFAWNYQDDFFGGYDHGRQAGIISFADHHVVPGKKFWTRGNGPRGRMWDKILTDSDGPYIELMVGAYSDNQPDYSWLQPFETRSCQMFWYPFRGIGGVKNANLEAAVNLDVAKDHGVELGFCTTAAHRSARASLQAGDHVLLSEDISIDPATPYVKELSLPAGVEEHQLRASLSIEGRELVAYSPVKLAPAKMPEPVTGPPSPKEIATVEQLYLAGLRIEQFHHPNLEPEPYWEEALARDPGDARVNTALGIRRLKQARFAEAERHLRRALERLTTHYTSPKDGEPFYYLGLALAAQEKFDAAFDEFYKAGWCEPWKGPAYFALAEIATRRGQFNAALQYVDRSLAANKLNLRALNLKAALLRHTGAKKSALALLAQAAETTDPLDARLLAERWLAGDKQAGRELTRTVAAHPATALETAAEYANAGLWQDGATFLAYVVAATKERPGTSPLAGYYLALFAEKCGRAAEAASWRAQAAQSPPDYVFPFQAEVIPVLRRALEVNPQDARAAYYLGNLLFDWQPAEAVKYWRQSAAADPSFAIVHRNLALAYAHQQPAPDLARAVAELELAVAAPVKYPQHFSELDELYARTGAAPAKRLALLEQNHELISKRDEALSREIGLKVFAGKYDEAIRLMVGRKFSIWEGGSLDVADHWVDAHLLRGQAALRQGQAAGALADFQAARKIPDNLPTDREGGRVAEIDYWLGVARQAMGDAAKAREHWQGVAAAETPSPRRRTDARISERQIQAWYRALAMKKLGQAAEAETAFRSLLETADKALEPRDTARGSAPRGATDSTLALAHYLAGLCHVELDHPADARSHFQSALTAAPDFLGARVQLDALR